MTVAVAACTGTPKADAAAAEKAILALDAVHATWTAVMKTPGLKLTLIPERIDIAAAGDVAIDVGRAETEVPTPTGVATSTSKYMHVWRKVGGEWRLFYSMSNSNAPPAAAPTAPK